MATTPPAASACAIVSLIAAASSRMAARASPRAAGPARPTGMVSRRRRGRSGGSGRGRRSAPSGIGSGAWRAQRAASAGAHPLGGEPSHDLAAGPGRSACTGGGDRGRARWARARSAGARCAGWSPRPPAGGRPRPRSAPHRPPDRSAVSSADDPGGAWPGRLRPTGTPRGVAAGSPPRPARARTTGGRAPARPPARRGRPTAARPPRPGPGSSGASGQELAPQYVVVLELDPTGRRVLGVVDVDADLGQLDRAGAELLAAAGGWPPRRATRRAAGGRSRSWPSAAGTGSSRRPAAGAAPGRPGRPAAPRRPGAAARVAGARPRRSSRRSALPVVVDELDEVRSRELLIGRSPVIRPAASLPEISTIGTPTPGWVPEPTKTTFGQVAVQVGRAERAGLEEGVRGGERGAGGHALLRPVGRGDRPGAPRPRRRSRRSRARSRVPISWSA